MTTMTMQEAYDRMKAYFSKPDAELAREWDEYGGDEADGQCVYRTSYGRKCAVGCLIPDENYRPYFEGIAVPKLVELLRRLADGHITIREFIDDGAEATTVDLYQEDEDFNAEAEQENAGELHALLDSDQEKIVFLGKAQLLHDSESADADEFVSKLRRLALGFNVTP